MVVLTRARQYHRVVVAMWEPRITGPAATGSMLEIYSKKEEQTCFNDERKSSKFNHSFRG